MPLIGEYAPASNPRSREQAERYEASGGQELADVDGHPIIVLTTLGARSGALRKYPLMRIEHEGSYAVIASNGGSPAHPTWYHNIVGNSHVELQDGAVKRDFYAHEATGLERDRWWSQAVRAWPYYADYVTRTDRVIPLFVLTPLPDEH